jgi:hypothetical protein
VNGADATPDALVATVIVAVLLLNTPDAPLPGAVNVTFTPGTGLLLTSRTVTASALAKAVLTTADCGVVPAFAVIDVACGGVTVKPLGSVATSPPVISVTVRSPATAAPAIVMFVVALVALFTVTLFTAMSAPKLTTVVPCTKCVFCPTMATFSVCPGCPVFGVTDVSDDPTVRITGTVIASLASRAVITI